MEEILLVNKFFPIVDTRLSCENIARQSCVMVPRWRFLATFFHPVFSASHVQHISDLHSKFALRPVEPAALHAAAKKSDRPHTMCPSMVDIQRAAVEITRGKKIEEEERNHRMKI